MLREVFVRSAYNYDMDAASDESALVCTDPTRTAQEFKDECDINTIVRNFGIGMPMPEIIRTPLEGDFSTVTDYQTALNMIMEADEAFMTIPAAIREQFQNDPGVFVAFVSDPANGGRIKEMGLGRIEPPVPAPIEVRVVSEPSPASPAASAAS